MYSILDSIYLFLIIKLFVYQHSSKSIYCKKNIYMTTVQIINYINQGAEAH